MTIWRGCMAGRDCQGDTGNNAVSPTLKPVAGSSPMSLILSRRELAQNIRACR
jgi:hypothetical protein